MANPRILRDADSHLMELPDFLTRHADPAWRAKMPRIAMDSPAQRTALGDAIEHRAHAPERVAELAAAGSAILSARKDYLALGGFNGGERSQVLDLLGFASQVVFPSWSALPVFFGDRPGELRHAIARALNRGVAEFCAPDPRLIGVGVLPVGDPGPMIETLEMLIGLGLRHIWVPHIGGPDYGFRPRDLDPVWARMAESGVALMIHVLPSANSVAAADRGNAIVPQFGLDGDEGPRGERMVLATETSPELCLAKLILDGVLERHRRLRCAVTECGAGWVPGMMRRLDAIAARVLRGGGSDRAPSQQILDQCAFTPYHYEDVGALIGESDSRLYMFSTDYPHIEGGADPIGSFRASLAGCSDLDRALFYAGNFERIIAGA
jgi:predicted TIM-barrel fold metal-dependent hydrolase